MFRTIPVKVSDFYNALSTAKDACAAEIAQESEDTGPFNWWSAVLRFDWSKAKPDARGTVWVNVYAIINGKEERVALKFADEIHSKMIMPIDDDEIAAMQSRFKYELKKRDPNMAPSLDVLKYRVQVGTEDDGITIKTNEQGEEILPDPCHISPYFAAIELYNEAFQGEIELQKKMGKIINQSQRTKLKGSLKGILVVNNTNVINMYQRYISASAPKNAGAELPNPIARMTMPLNGENFKTAFYDRTKLFFVEKKKRFEKATVDEKPIDAHNLHNWITAKSIHNGVVRLDSVCFSNMGASIPARLDTLVSERHCALVYDALDAMDSSDDEPPQPPRPAPATRHVTPEEAEDEVDGLIDEFVS